MSVKEANRLSVMQQIDKKILTMKRASYELGISLRQTKRLRKRYKLEGETGLISKRRGRSSWNQIPQQTRKRSIEILQDPLLQRLGTNLCKRETRSAARSMRLTGNPTKLDDRRGTLEK